MTFSEILSWRDTEREVLILHIGYSVAWLTFGMYLSASQTCELFILHFRPLHFGYVEGSSPADFSGLLLHFFLLEHVLEVLQPDTSKAEPHLKWTQSLRSP